MAKPSRLSFFSALIAVTVAAVSAAEAQVYKWVDERGRVTYSSTPPPPGRSGREVQIAPGPTREQTDAARQRTESVQELNRRFAEERQRRNEAPAAGAAAEAPATRESSRATERTSERPTVRIDDRVLPPPAQQPRPLPAPIIRNDSGGSGEPGRPPPSGRGSPES